MVELIFLAISAFIFYKLVWPILSEVLWPGEDIDNSIGEVDTPTEVTTEDLILHDMVNENDTYDIGEINFND